MNFKAASMKVKAKRATQKATNQPNKLIYFETTNLRISMKNNITYFRNEVERFCENYKGVTIKRSVLGSLLYTQEESTTAAKEDDLDELD